jgi:hypothetical protein
MAMDFKEYSELFHALDRARPSSARGGKEAKKETEDYVLAKKVFNLVEKNIDGYLPSSTSSYFRQRYEALRSKYLSRVMTTADSSAFRVNPDERSAFNSIYYEALKNREKNSKRAIGVQPGSGKKPSMQDIARRNRR